MAMRSRGGGAGASRRGARTGVVRAVYEDFRPISEWHQDDESHILNINLPGFMKEQIKVWTEGRNTIRVRGERLVAGNKWSRFREDYQVPENGEMNNVHAKFQGGILSITIPRKVDKAQETTLTPNPTKDHSTVLREASTSQPDEKQQKTNVDPTNKRVDNGQDKPFGSSLSADEKSIEPEKASEDYRSESIASGAGHDDVTAKAVYKETKNAKKLPDDETAKKKTMEKELYGGLTYKKGLAELNEERQLLVNMGVAMLVIVALTAYVTYNFATQKD